MRFFTLLFIIVLIAACNTTPIIREPSRNPMDPSLVRVSLYLGKDRDIMLKKMQAKYILTQKKSGKNGKYYPPHHSFVYYYKKRTITSLLLVVQQKSPHLRSYTGKLPFKLYRRDTYNSVTRKLGEPSNQSDDKTTIEYESKGLKVKFMKGIISSVTLYAK